MRILVVGAGVVGLAVADALVRRARDAGGGYDPQDIRVLEAGEPMGARSVGGSRIFRLAHGRAELVAAAERSRPLWDAWSRRARRPLIGSEGAIISGSHVPTWAAAMEAAGARHQLGEDPGTLPGPVAGPVVYDPAGGVIDVNRVGALLRATAMVEQVTVRAVYADGTVVTDAGSKRADAVVVTAGAGTAPLVRPLGIDVPAMLEHHVRFSFRQRAGAAAPAAPCWLDGEGSAGMASTYQHRTPEGWWAVGGHLPEQLCALDLGVNEVTARWRAVVPAYAAEYLPGVNPEPVEEVACTPTIGLSDGVHTARVGAVHALWGENLFKLAPLLGDELADAVVGDRVAHAIGMESETEASDHLR